MPIKPFLTSLSLSLLLLGCGSKVVYKEVLTPIKCPLKMPLKPTFNGSFESARLSMIYFLKCEEIAKECIGEEEN